mgnify:CR=1 FL=1
MKLIARLGIGIISFLLYLMFIIHFYKTIKRHYRKGGVILLAFFYMYLAMMLVQGGQEVYMMLLLNLALLGFGVTGLNRKFLKIRLHEYM